MTNRKLMIVDPLSSHGGLHYYVNDQARALQAHGLEVFVASPFHFPESDEAYAHFQCFDDVYSSKPKYWRALKLVKDYIAAIRFAKSRGVDTILFHIFKSDIFEYLGTGIARLYGMKVITLIHDVERLDANSNSSFSASIIRRAHHIVTHNAFSRDQILRNNPDAAGRIVIVPHGNYSSHFPRLVSREDARKALDLPPDENILLFFGNPRREKGLHILLDALAKLKEKRRFLLLFAGKMKEDQFQEHQQFIDAHGLAPFVRMDVGHVHDDAVQDYYRASDLVVLPYLRVYESGVALMAGTLGRPAVSSDLPVFSEMAEQGAGLALFPSGDAPALAEAIDAALFDRPRLDQMAGSNHRYALENRDWTRIIAPLAERISASS